LFVRLTEIHTQHMIAVETFFIKATHLGGLKPATTRLRYLVFRLKPSLKFISPCNGRLKPLTMIHQPKPLQLGELKPPQQGFAISCLSSQAFPLKEASTLLFARDQTPHRDPHDHSETFSIKPPTSEDPPQQGFDILFFDQPFLLI
jgi:hypothetical protein